MMLTPNGSHPHKPLDPRFDFLSFYAQYIGISVRKTDDMNDCVWRGTVGSGLYSMLWNNHQVIIDFSDLTTEGIMKRHISPHIPTVKMHYYPEYVAAWQPVYPLGPWMDFRSMENMRKFFKLSEENIYTCNSDIILNNQKAHSRALARRKVVQDRLKPLYGNHFDCSYEFENQWFFWQKFSNCLVSIVIGGACPNMIDRGHMEQLALGVCTIFSGHSDLFAGRTKLLPWKHYVPVFPDYSNVVERVEWCKTHRDECRQIGHSARQFWLDHCHPEKYISALDNVVREHYGHIKETTAMAPEENPAR